MSYKYSCQLEMLTAPFNINMYTPSKSISVTYGNHDIQSITMLLDTTALSD